MSDDIEDLLARCLARLAAGADLDACLADAGPRAAELRPLLEAAASLRRLPVEPYSREALLAGKVRLRAVVASQAGRRPRLLASMWRTGAVFAAAAAVAIIALLALSTDVFRFGSTTGQAQVQGVLSAVRDGTIVVKTPDGELIIGVREETQVVDPQGQAQTPDQIPPGANVTVDLEDSGGTPTAGRVEWEDQREEEEGQPDATPPPATEVEFGGTVVAVSGSEITVQASFGTALVRTNGETEIKGSLSPGVTVKVHAVTQPDGSYLAREIEALGADGDGDDQEEDSSGPGGDSSDDD